MALKDWKKIGSFPEEVSFTNKKTSHTIHITDDSTYDSPNLYDVLILTSRYYLPGTKTLYRKTLTKSQALKFAKSYMRKH